MQKSFHGNRMPHAVLFHSQVLEVCENAALELAKIILKNNSPKYHPDLHTLRPVNKMRQISVSNTRSLINKLQLTPNQAFHKIAFIYEPDRMNQESANAFLKTLEEPPSDTFLFLLTTRPYDLLSTILSRCFTIALPSKNLLPDANLWKPWFEKYSDWLESLSESPKNTPANRIIGLCALVVYFDNILSDISNNKNKNDESLDLLTDEEKIAIDNGFRKGIRTRFLMEVEAETQKFANKVFQKTKRYPTKPFKDSIKSLEKSNALLSVNFQESASLEFFLLKMLRSWTYYFNK